MDLKDLADDTEGAEEERPQASRILEMRMSEFAVSGLVQEVKSGVLGEHILWVADNAEVPPGNTLVVYRADELKQLVGLTPDEVRHLHAVKKELDGELLDVDDDEGDRIILAKDLLAHNNTTCHACGQDNWWDNKGRPICAVCHPPHP